LRGSDFRIRLGQLAVNAGDEFIGGLIGICGFRRSAITGFRATGGQAEQYGADDQGKELALQVLGELRN